MLPPDSRRVLLIDVRPRRDILYTADAMRISGIDANLLIALNALLTERNVTRAAARIGVGQPALSHSLARLREHFKDPLLVQRGRELHLSEKALRMMESVAVAAAAFSRVFEERPGLDLRSGRRFVLAAADLFSLRFVPELERTLRRDAPGVTLEVRPLADRSTGTILSDGVDLAFGVFDDVPITLNQQSLFQDPFVCVLRADHPQVGASLSLRAFTRLPHLEVAPAPKARPGARIDRLLAAKGMARRVETRVPYFLLAARILESSDQVLTMTHVFAEELRKSARLRIVKCPLAIPPLSFSQIWLRQQDDDATHRWLRETCARICSTSISAVQAAVRPASARTPSRRRTSTAHAAAIASKKFGRKSVLI
jgi:DNA-binding transcriptional LysR family regulator